MYAQRDQKIFAVAPMIDWTDRPCRFFHRQLSSQALLYTEMIVADAIIHGDRDRHLAFEEIQHPIAVQLGGSDPGKLAEAARICADYGYDEINLNVGCPSDRVQSGTFGACLMKTPQVVADCVAAMVEVTDIPVTVKCRIGVDDQDTEEALDAIAALTFAAGSKALWVHARKAWLQGLSPKENRDIPPLDYNRVYRLKQKWPEKFIGINGGIHSIDVARDHLTHMDGVMLGRASYQNPQVLTRVDALLGATVDEVDMELVLETMQAYARQHIINGGRLIHITRHMVGLFQGRAGARRWRQILSTDAAKPGAGPEIIAAAYREVTGAGAAAEAA
ncbi:tRNA dihydrouridine(20/20a) synthase DusA [Limoniibacter endophyticus]|uniref:tRNA dihydrouridine(20/20a) synthase DusA n=1 Tax=Limoniibacter endophyticus TaxID=1565040 RepID=UPI00167AC581|nr:tRNA dihydrouridine(20/20a) synthase DusA [Limoniibacter endophyticus]